MFTKINSKVKTVGFVQMSANQKACIINSTVTRVTKEKDQWQQPCNTVEKRRPCRTNDIHRFPEMTSHRIGVNLRVSGNCDQGGRKYMEDTHAIKFVKKDSRDYEFAYFGIFDGHGGPEASRFARDHLLDEITKYEQFWSDDDDDVLFAIKSGFLDTHHAMWKELDKWPRTVSGLPSTSGTTASIAIVKHGKLFIGHVGDSGIVLGCDEGPVNAVYMKPVCLTKDHKPDNPEEKERIEKCGGSVVAKSGVQRVVWSRPKVNHKGPVRRSTQIDKIPFLAVARSLGDLWSYDYYKGMFIVSPEPDVSVMKVDPRQHRCLILASDGLWNMITPAEAVSLVTDLEMHFEDRVIHDPMVTVSYWINPAERLVARALNKWRAKMMKADNISCIVVLIDPLGPSKLTILRRRREEYFQKIHEARLSASSSRISTSAENEAAYQQSVSKINLNRNQSHGSEDADGVERVDVENKGEESSSKEQDCADNTNFFPGRGGLAPSDNHHNMCKHSTSSVSNTSHGKQGEGDVGQVVSDGNVACRSVPFGFHGVCTVPAFVNKGGRLRPTTGIKGVRTHRMRHLTDPQHHIHRGLLPVTSDMDDSVQATSSLNLTSLLFPLPLPSSVAEDPEDPDKRQHALSSSVSEPLLKLISLTSSKKASSHAESTLHVQSTASLNGSTHSPSKVITGSQSTDKRVLRRSCQSTAKVLQMRSPQQCVLGPDFFSSHSSGQMLLNQPEGSTGEKLSLRCCVPQCSNSALQGGHPISSNNGKCSDNAALRKACGTGQQGSNSVKTQKKGREFGFLYKTRKTLHRARQAARKALCPENPPFIRPSPTYKRKCDQRRSALEGPCSKRLRPSEGIRLSL